jgi:hypothetical protein
LADYRRRCIGDRKIVYYMDRSSYNTSLYTEEILQCDPYIQFAVRATAKFNPIEAWNSEVKFVAKRDFYNLGTKEKKIENLVGTMKNVSATNIQKFYWEASRRVFTQLGLGDY